MQFYFNSLIEFYYIYEEQHSDSHIVLPSDIVKINVIPLFWIVLDQIDQI